ncbi:MAG: AraC family transcriptional regulator [Clostridiaceae bacterium]|nr:AraC family transcriptional regulator [Clostridiaceae bacterium]
MRGKKRISSVYKRFLYSFLVIVILVTSLSAVIAYLFGKAYEEQICNDSQSMLVQIGTQFDERIFQTARSTYLDMAGNEVLYPNLKGFLDHSLAESVNCYQVYCSLQAALSRAPEIFSSISVYNRAANVVISSQSGVNWLDDRWHSDDGLQWTQETAAQNKNLYWNYTPSVITDANTTDPILALYGTYPLNVPGTECRGVFEIRLNPDALGQMLCEYQNQQTSYYFLDRNGRTIASTGGTIDFNHLLSSELPVISEKEQVSIHEIDGITSVVVSRPYQKKYILVSVASMASFYAKINLIQKKIMMIGLLIILLGLLLSGLLSNRLYKPLKLLIEPAQKQFGAMVNPGGKPQDEYAYIHAVLDKLSEKASSLEVTLNQSYPLIWNGLFQGLLTPSSMQEDELQEKLAFLKIKFQYPLFCLVLLRIPEILLREMRMEQKEYILYGLLNGYNEYHNKDVKLYGIKNASYSLTLVCNLSPDAWENRNVWVEELRQICYGYADIWPELCVSNCVGKARELSLAYKKAQELEQYFYFMTDRDYLAEDRIPALQGEPQNIPSQVIEDFVGHIKVWDMTQAQADIETLVVYCKSGEYTVQQCNQRLLSLLFFFSRFVRNANLCLDDLFYERIHAEFLECCNIDQFKEWMTDTMHRYFLLQDKTASGKYSSMIKDVTVYIEQHLGESISLDYLADLYQISANYLSRLFKEETGVNFTDYVNRSKLNRAAELLNNSTKNIDEIAETTGFNSSAYFIKKFKQEYGITPKKYRMNAITQKNAIKSV